MDELRPWIERARGMSARAEEVFVIANNHYRGNGPANALMVKSTLSSGRVRAPADLIATHPRLKDMADPVSRPRSPGRGRDDCSERDADGGYPFASSATSVSPIVSVPSASMENSRIPSILQLPHRGSSLNS